MRLRVKVLAMHPSQIMALLWICIPRLSLLLLSDGEKQEKKMSKLHYAHVTGIHRNHVSLFIITLGSGNVH